MRANPSWAFFVSPPLDWSNPLMVDLSQLLRFTSSTHSVAKRMPRRRKNLAVGTNTESLEPRLLLSGDGLDSADTDLEIEGEEEESLDASRRRRRNPIPDGAGNRRRRARDIGVLDAEQTFNDYVGRRDKRDWYRFEVSTSSTFQLDLTGLTADIDVFLKNRRGRTLERSINPGANSESISVDLEAGIYHVLVAPWRRNSSFYELSLSATALDPPPPADPPPADPPPSDPPSDPPPAPAPDPPPAPAPDPDPAPTPEPDPDPAPTPDPDPVPTPMPDPLPTPEFNADYGSGLVNANAAVSLALGFTNQFGDEPTFGGSNDWNINMVQAPEVWAQGYTGAGMTVAVIDTGVDYRHVDLDNNVWVNMGEVAGDGIDNDGNGYVDDVNGWDFVSDDNLPLDENGHGTHVAGSIAAERNGFGATGVAYDANIMPIRVLDASGSGSSLDVALGIRYAASNGADVINLSLGGGFSSSIFNAIQFAASQGSIVVMASGNEGASLPSFPARHADQFGIAVGAVNINNNTASFSNGAGTGTLDYVVAPGVTVFSTIPGNSFANFSGTSMATPHVAGVAALVKQANSSLSAAEYENIIVSTAVSNGVNGSGSSSSSGSGSGIASLASSNQNRTDGSSSQSNDQQTIEDEQLQLAADQIAIASAVPTTGDVSESTLQAIEYDDTLETPENSEATPMDLSTLDEIHASLEVVS
ncbi:MAG: hypothetical protein CMJ78_11965 [Planctomycetaceae bacterium]|nr:hypothetical protein [Planctomycetaceae bacterium]